MLKMHLFFFRKVDLVNGGKPSDVEWCEDDANAPIPKDRALHQGGELGLLLQNLLYRLNVNVCTRFCCWCKHAFSSKNVDFDCCCYFVDETFELTSLQVIANRTIFNIIYTPFILFGKPVESDSNSPGKAFKYHGKCSILDFKIKTNNK